MKAASILIAFSLAVVACAQGQGHDVKPADAMKNISFMEGDWNGTQQFLFGSNAKGEVISNVHLTIGGRFLEEALNVTMQNGRKSDTRHFMTFDPADGKYHAWWFNGSSYSVMEFSGDFDGKNLVMVSKPIKMGDNVNTFRVTYEKLDNGYGYGLEFMTSDTPWTKQFHTVYTKK